MNINYELEQAWLKSGLTQKEAGALCGVSGQRFNRWVNNQRERLSRRNLFKVKQFILANEGDVSRVTILTE